jgi:hypothetical protein
VTTSNYNRFTNSGTLLFIRAHTYVFSVCCVSTSLLAAAPKGGRSSSSGFQRCPRASATSFSQQQLTTFTPQQSSNSLTQQPTTFHVTIYLAPHLSCLYHLGTDRIEDTAPLLQCSCCREIVAFVSVGLAVTCQRLLYGSLFRVHYLATGIHATIYSY